MITKGMTQNKVKINLFQQVVLHLMPTLCMVTQRVYTKSIQPKTFATENQEISLNPMATFVTVHQRCPFFAVTIVKTPT